MCIRDRNIMSILDRIAHYWLKWLEHLKQMDFCHIPKQLLNYKPKGWRGVGYLKKRWSDNQLQYLLGAGTNNFLLFNP